MQLPVVQLLCCVGLVLVAVLCYAVGGRLHAALGSMPLTGERSHCGGRSQNRRGPAAQKRQAALLMYFEVEVLMSDGYA